MGNGVFLEEDGAKVRPFCNAHFTCSSKADTKSPVIQDAGSCHICGGGLHVSQEPCFALAGKKFHQRCVTCMVCDVTFPGGAGIYLDPTSGDEEFNSFLCQTHYLEATAPKCTSCRKFITVGRMVDSGGKKYHEACFSGDIAFRQAGIVNH